MKKFIYRFLIFFVALIVAIVFAANSSFVIKKVADIFAPEYKISYEDITGNVFTGVHISGLKFADKTLIKTIKFSWNPSKILYKRVAINELSGEDLNVDTLKALIAFFSESSENNSTSSPLPVVINVDKIHLTVNSFDEQDIHFKKTVLDVEDASYATDDVSVDKLFLSVESNVTNLVLHASLAEGKVTIDDMVIKNIDSEALENMFLGNSEDNVTGRKEEKKVVEHERNPLMPQEVELKKLFLTVKPRTYKTANIDKLSILLSHANIDINKILSNKKSAINVGKYTLDFKSDVGQINLTGDLKDDTVTVDDMNLSKLDTLALQAMFVSDNNESNVSKEEVLFSEEQNQTEPQEVNELIPRYLKINALHTDIVPAIYNPVHIHTLALDIKDLKVNIAKLLVEQASISLLGKTNLTNFTHSSKIKNNTLIGQIRLTPNQRLFELYDLPLRKEAIGDIVINLEATEKEITVDVKSSAKNILISQRHDSNNTDSNQSKEFNVDIDSLVSHIVYTLKGNILHADSNVMITTPYAKDISVTNTFAMDNNISYKGEVKVKELVGMDANLSKPLKNLHLHYVGDLKSIDANISTDGLKGSFISSNFQKGLFHIETRHALNVNKMIALPAELNGTNVNAVIDVPLDFEKITPLTAKAKITSNISNIDADITYEKGLEVNITSTLPNDSLLKHFDENIQWDALMPLVAHANLAGEDAVLTLHSKALSSHINYELENGQVNGTLKVAGLLMTIKGIAKEKISINSKVNSVDALLKSVQSVYTLEGLPKIEGALNLSVDILKLKQANLSLSSPKIIYHADHETEYFLSDIKMLVSADTSKVQLKSYNVVYDEMKIFSTKPSQVNIKKSLVTIPELWVNDQLKAVGTYDMKTRKGTIEAKAKDLHIGHKMIDLDSAINLKTVLDGNRTSVNGKITLLGGDIHYDMSTKTYPSDSDIVIVQEMQKNKASSFMDNLSALIEIKTKKPLVYKQDPINIKAKVDLAVNKTEHAPLLVLGEVQIIKGGSYTFQGKKFVLDKSYIYFTGNPNKPLLDMHVKYKSLNYLITIGISGTPSAPNIMFSSVPSLKKEQILSIILFDSEEGAGTNSGEDMMKMMGGAMAKSALNDMGIKLDHLAIGADGSVEVGKKITDKITFIYVNGEVPEVKVKYQHSQHTESVISADEISQSYDIVYKRDF